MVTLPPPTLPTVPPTQAVPPASIPVALDVISVSNTVAALQQRVVVQVLSIDIDLSRQLLNVLTPQGQISLSLPQAGTGSQITLPNGQPVPLQSVLQGTSAADIKSGLLLQLDPRAPTLAGPQPPAARLLLAPDILAPRAPLTAPSPTTPPTPSPDGILRTQAIPLPAGSFDFTAAAAAQTAAKVTVSASLFGRLATAIQNQLAPTSQQPSPPPVTTSRAPTSPLANQTVEVSTTPRTGAVEATIVGNTPRGDVAVRTANGETLTLPHIRSVPNTTDGEVAVGTKLYLRPVVDARATANTAAPQLPVLQAVLEELQASNPMLAARIAAQTLLPLQSKSAAQVAGTMLFFLTALTGGSFANPQVTLAPTLQRLLGKPVQDKLVEELSSLTRATPDSSGVEWRGYQLPTPPLDGLQSPVWLYVQQRRDDNAGNNGNDNAPQAVRQTRFLVDLQLTRMGHTQLEGIAQLKNGANQIDLKLNTPQPLPPTMQNELKSIFTNAASAYGFAGEFLFTSGTVIDFRARAATTQTV
jgi:hypothetical protein